MIFGCLEDYKHNSDWGPYFCLAIINTAHFSETRKFSSVNLVHQLFVELSAAAPQYLNNQKHLKTPCPEFITSKVIFP